LISNLQIGEDMPHKNTPRRDRMSITGTTSTPVAGRLGIEVLEPRYLKTVLDIISNAFGTLDSGGSLYNDVHSGSASQVKTTNDALQIAAGTASAVGGIEAFSGQAQGAIVATNLIALGYAKANALEDYSDWELMPTTAGAIRLLADVSQIAGNTLAIGSASVQGVADETPFAAEAAEFTTPINEFAAVNTFGGVALGRLANNYDNIVSSIKTEVSSAETSLSQGVSYIQGGASGVYSATVNAVDAEMGDLSNPDYSATP
jgi:hypothetical protein